MVCPGCSNRSYCRGNKAITTPVENAEDDEEQGWNDLKEHNVSEKDVVVGVAASGTTPM